MEEQLSLCVSEYDDNNTLLWRRIGDYIGANRVLYPVQRGSQPEPEGFSPHARGSTSRAGAVVV